MFPKIVGFPPKSSILIGFSIIFTIHFWVPLFLETPTYSKNGHTFWSRGCNFSKHHFGYGFVEFRVCECCFFGKQKVSIECKLHMDVQDRNNHSEGSLSLSLTRTLLNG